MAAGRTGGSVVFQYTRPRSPIWSPAVAGQNSQEPLSSSPVTSTRNVSLNTYGVVWPRLSIGSASGQVKVVELLPAVLTAGAKPAAKAAGESGVPETSCSDGCRLGSQASPSLLTTSWMLGQ